MNASYSYTAAPYTLVNHPIPPTATDTPTPEENGHLRSSGDGSNGDGFGDHWNTINPWHFYATGLFGMLMGIMFTLMFQHCFTTRKHGYISIP